MCRFLVYRGREVLLADLLTRPKHSLITQSFKARERPEPLNGDGFGIGWYAPQLKDESPCLFTSITPAWANANLHRLADKISSNCIFAHLRAASPGLIVSEVNCHPFLHDRYLWMHNGHIQDFLKIKRRLRESLNDETYNVIQGTTDTEHAFALFLNLLPEGVKLYTASVLRETMLRTIRQLESWSKEAGIDEPSMFNFAMTDGKTIVATRYSSKPTEREPESLYYSSAASYKVEEEDGQAHLDPKSAHAVLVASEPLTPTKEGWHKVPSNHLLVITEKLHIDFYPIEI